MSDKQIEKGKVGIIGRLALIYDFFTYLYSTLHTKN